MMQTVKSSELSALKTEAANSSRMLAHMFRAVRRHIPEVSLLHSCCHGNLKPDILIIPNREALAVSDVDVAPVLERDNSDELFQNDGAGMGDVTGVYEVGSSDVLGQEAEVVPCPICRKTFLVKDIEVTA
jgi:hypothetical protein